MMSTKTQIQTWMQRERSTYVPALWWVSPERLPGLLQQCMLGFLYRGPEKKRGVFENKHINKEWNWQCYQWAHSLKMASYMHAESINCWRSLLREHSYQHSLFHQMLVSVRLFSQSCAHFSWQSLYIHPFSVSVGNKCSLVYSIIFHAYYNQWRSYTINHPCGMLNKYEPMLVCPCGCRLTVFFLFSFRIKCYLHHRLFHAGVAQIQSKIDSALCLCVFA